jgi:hypothetical protein
VVWWCGGVVAYAAAGLGKRDQGDVGVGRQLGQSAVGAVGDLQRKK